MGFSRKEIRKDAIIRLRTTEAEKKLLEQKAADCGMSTSQYLLKCGLGRPVRSKIAATIINDLRAVISELKLHRNQINAETETEYATVLAYIAETISRIPVDATENF